MKKFIFTTAILFSSLILFAAVDSKVIFNQGLEAFKSGNYSSAELLFRKTLENDDDFRDQAWFYLARTILQQGKYKAAIFEFNSFLTKCRSENLRIESRFWMGEAYFLLTDSLKAIEEYNRFLEKSDNISMVMAAHDRIANIYITDKRYEEAVIEWEKSLKISQNMEENAQIVLKIGKALFLNSSYDKALERLLPLLSARINSRDKAEVRLLIGRIYQLQGDHKKALASLNAIPKDLSDSYPFYDVYYFRALSYINTGRVSAAKNELEFFHLIGEKSEYYYPGLFELANIIISSTKPESGVEILSEIIENCKDEELSAKSALLLAQYFINISPEKAIEYLEKFTQIKSEEEQKKILLVLLRAYIKTQSHEKAEKIVSLYLEKYPYDENIDEVMFNKGILLIFKGDFNTALQVFDDLKVKNPFSKFLNDTDYYMAVINIKKKKNKDAINLLKSYLSKKDIEHSFDAHKLLAELYIEEGELEKAKPEINLLISRYSKYPNVDELIYKLAKALYEKKNSSARNYFSILQNNFAESSFSALVDLIYANEFYEKKNYEKAIIHYEKYLNSNNSESRGDAYFNLLQSNYKIKRYNRIIEIVKSMQIPALDEAQWMELPLIQIRSYYNLGQYDAVYNLTKWEDISSYPPADIELIIDSVLKVRDAFTASKMAESLQDENLKNEMLLKIGYYYYSEKDFNSAKSIFERIISSQIGDSIKDKAKIAMAEIFSETGSYENSFIYLNLIVLKENIPSKEALTILNYFYSGREREGASLTEENLSLVSTTRYIERILLLNLLFHYNQKDIKSFNKYLKYLTPYQENTNYVYYLSGKINYELGNYNQSYFHFYKIAQSENEYTTEANYYLGMLNLLLQKNKNMAMKYFNKTITQDNGNSEYGIKSKLELAILYYEQKNYSMSSELLQQIIKEHSRGKFNLQAENLYDFFFNNQQDINQ
ncbi:MAG TPA: tetratricopeptide repeat protein [Spirochaetota bacterium]|nr:tetratricopeptide repeat protein [Spirochaetota bacterium]HRS63390.1 tetratricopeptide repeat protein [Spirochaetota bacterium]